MKSLSSKSGNTGGTNFLITVYHQENHSYQGVVQWLESGEKIHFRSELELLNLIHEAIDVGDNKHQFRCWGNSTSSHVS